MTGPSRERIEELIRREAEVMQRVVAFIRSGMASGRIGAEHGEMLIETAERNYEASVKLLRQLLDSDTRPSGPAAH